jgi:predicted DNA-binding protein
VKSTTAKRVARDPDARPEKARATGVGPLSVPLPVELRERLASEAKKRRLKMATAARVLLDERIGELEDAELLSQAEEWQRAQAWATWEKIKAGDKRDVPMERFAEHAAAALERLDSKAKAGAR